MAIAEFTFNNKMYIATKLSPFNINYRRELRMNFQIRKKKKHVKVEEFVKETKEIYEEVKVILKELQEEIKNIQIEIERR